MADIRDEFFADLASKLRTENIKAVIKIETPKNGPTVKLNGVDLYKVLRVPNPFRDKGVAIYRKLSDEAIATVGGKRAKGKNKWVAAPLTDENYNPMIDLLLGVAKSFNKERNFQMKKAKEELVERVSRPKTQKGKMKKRTERRIENDTVAENG